MVKRVKFDKPFYVNGLLIDPKRNTVESGEERRKISPRALDILKCLIRSDTQSVTYQDLADEVWGAPTDETVVYQQVAILRKILGDDPGRPTFIKTLPKRGYELIADVYFSEQEQSTEKQPRYLRSVMLLSAAIALLGVVSVWLFSAYSKAASPKEIFLQSMSHLRYPQRIVALEMPDVADDGGLANVAKLLAEQHLDLNPHLHVVDIPKISDRRWLQRLTGHFSDITSIEFLIKPVAGNAAGEPFGIGLEVVEPATGNVVASVAMPLGNTPSDAAAGLAEFEKSLVQTFASLNLIDARQPVFLNSDTDSNRLLLSLAKMDSKLDVMALGDKQQMLALTSGILDGNPDNLVAYSMLLDLALSMVLSNSDFDIAAFLSILKPYAEKMLESYPDYYKSHYMMSMYRYWIQDYTAAALNMSTAMKMKPFHPWVLLNLSWNLKTFGEVPLQVDRINHAINPFELRTVAFYRDSLLANNMAGEAIAMLDYHDAWNIQPRNWQIAAQTQVDSDKLKEFSAWYRQRFAQLDDDPAKAMQARQLDRSNVPSRYIGYMLLNADQPARARFWQQHGREDQMAYFDIRIIDALADIWQGQWQSEKWLALSDVAEERRAFQHTTDKLNIIYFHFYSGLYGRAEQYLLEVFPELAGPQLVITRDNFRYVVYYAYIQKRIGNYADATRINQALKQYLSSLTQPPDRDVDFGIADVEFYSLLGDQHMALALLEQAIREQGWMPNAFWRWPPIERNVSLANLRGMPEFDALAGFVHRQLTAFCFDVTCK